MKSLFTVLLGLCMIGMPAQTPPPESWPRISINGKTTGRISRAEVNNASRLAVMRSDGSIDSSLKVVSFQLSIWTSYKNPASDLNTYPGRPKGDSLTQSLKQWIMSQPAGSRIYFESI